MDAKPKILIVDDEPSARQTLEALLWREGYELSTAVNGLDALAYLEEHEPDTILLDVMMPEMDGFTVCQQLRKDERWRHIPIILITALDNTDELTRGLDAGADEFLSKPVNGPELRARVRSMLRIKKQYDELQAMLRLREDLVDMVFHDMRNPLAVMMLQCEVLLRDNELSETGMEDLKLLRSQLQRLDSFVNDMLMEAKMEDGQLVLNRMHVDVAELVLQTKESFEVLAEVAGIQLIFDLPEQKRGVFLDAHLFSRVLDNLLSNALKFSPDNSTVTVRIGYPTYEATHSAKAFALRLQVIDEGPGIPQEYWDSVFEKFKVVSLKEKRGLQIGLGLAFCKLVVEAHKGQIYISANEPRGTVITVEI